MCRFTFNFKEEREAYIKFNANSGKEGARPTWLGFESLSLCSHRCRYCFSGSGSIEYDKSVNIYTEEELELIIKNAKNAGVQQVTLLGGEPLLHPEIVNITRKFRENGIIVHMGTNGYHATEEIVKKLSDAGLTQVQINIDHIKPEIHDYIRGIEGSYKKTVEAIQLFKKHGIGVVLVSVMLKINRDILPDIFRLAKEWGCDAYRIWEFMPSETGAKHYDELAITAEEFYATILSLLRAAEKLGVSSITTLDPLMYAAFDMIPEFRKYRDRVTILGCPVHKKQMYSISFDKNIYACCSDRDVPLTDFHSFVPPYLSEYVEALKNSKREICGGCDYFWMCYGGCPTRAKKYLDRDNKPYLIDAACIFYSKKW